MTPKQVYGHALNILSTHRILQLRMPYQCQARERVYIRLLLRLPFDGISPRANEVREMEAEAGLLLRRHRVVLRDQEGDQVEVLLAPAFVQLRLPHRDGHGPL